MPRSLNRGPNSSRAKWARDRNHSEDPLAFAIEEAHRRGLELHAWFNPFRVRAPVLKGGVAGNYVTRTRPEFVRTYGSQLWMDPGLKAVHDYSIRVILDVVRRYNIDGVHLDDYFYPYPERNAAGQNIDFPDGPSWKLYTAAGGRLNRADWRRKNVDDFVHALNQKIKAEKKWVKFGISPFGIWQPGFPKQVTRGLNAYDYLYADSRKWLANGWADYFVPQLYWAIDGDQSFPALLHWWSSQNSKSRLLCAGNDATKVGTAWTSTEIVKQIRITQKQAGAAGNVLWNMTSLLQNNAGLADSLRKGPFASPAVVPVCSWLNPGAPAKPILKPEADQPRLSWRDPGEKEIWLWVYQTQRGGKWATTIFPGHKTSISLPKEGSATRPDVVAVTALNRYGAAGPTSVLDLRKATPPSRTDRASSP
ncbi:MAG: family 10 glycosylhydrolase [Verrucomicrobiota bacterium]